MNRDLVADEGLSCIRMGTEYSDPYSISVFGDTRRARRVRLVIDCHIEPDLTYLVGQVLAEDGEVLVEGHRSWEGFRRELALASGKLLARELEHFVDPF